VIRWISPAALRDGGSSLGAATAPAPATCPAIDPTPHRPTTPRRRRVLPSTRRHTAPLLRTGDRPPAPLGGHHQRSAL